jgi:hypothetical protein
MGYCFTSTSEQLSYGLILCQLIIIVMPTNVTGLGPRSKAVGKVKFLDQVRHAPAEALPYSLP